MTLKDFLLWLAKNDAKVSAQMTTYYGHSQVVDIVIRKDCKATGEHLRNRHMFLEHNLDSMEDRLELMLRQLEEYGGGDIDG